MIGVIVAEIQELRKLIKIELSDCDSERFPFLCKMQSTEKGYARIEEMIIRYAAKEAMPIGSAIALIEQELAHSQEEIMTNTEVYIDYLDSKNKFKETRKHFKDYDSALAWMKQNFEKWDLDMIHF